MPKKPTKSKSATMQLEAKSVVGKKKPILRVVLPYPIYPPMPPPVICQPNKYPGILKEPEKISVLGTKMSDYQELCSLLNIGFFNADRMLLLTPWGNYGVFKEFNGDHTIFFLYDGCTCIMNVLKYYDLKLGTAGLLYFQSTHEIISYILENRFKREKYKYLMKTDAIDNVCRKFCSEGGENIYKVCDTRGDIFNVNDYHIKECMFMKPGQFSDSRSSKYI